MNNQFSENLKRIRKENNLSQEQLADELGVSRQAISKWESAVAYPEMDKIIALCDKFNVNIDDLLHKDIKEIKGEEESKKKLNSIIDDFLSFVTNTINMFSNMNFKSKIKCIFEQIVIAGILFLLSLAIGTIIGDLFENLIGFLPTKAFYFVINLLNSILIVGLAIASIIIIAHIFKTRYLDYYDKIKKETKEEIDEETIEDDKKEKIDFKKEDKKIIIRDPKHSEYSFIKTLFKCIIGIIKFFLLLLGLFIAFVLISLLVLFVASFLLAKTGLFFIGLLVTILSSIVIAVIFLLLVLNIVFNRTNDKKKMIWSFITSLIAFGIGCGLILIGSLSFDVLDNEKSKYNTITEEYNMKNDLVIYEGMFYNVEYVKSNNNNIKVEYSVSKYCSFINDYDEKREKVIYAWADCENPIKVAREFIKNAKNKKIIPMSDSIAKVTVYTTQSNIDKLKKNWANYLKEVEKNEEERNAYERRIEELEQQNFDLQQQINNLQEELDH